MSHADLARFGERVEAQTLAWARKRAEYLPEAWKRGVLAQHADRRAENEQRGNTWLRELVEDMRTGGALSLDATDAEIRARGRDLAASMFEIASALPARTIEGLRAGLEDAVRRHGIEPPKPDTGNEGACARMLESDWWIRRLRVAHGQRIEYHAIALGYVHKRAGCYVSDVNVKRRREQRARNAKALESVELQNQHGDAFTLAELAERSNANPVIRRNELMTRIAGFERIAVDLGHAAEFWTGTAPSRFHAVHFGGQRNAKHDGSTPRDAQAHLVKCWAKCRAAMQRRGIRPYGFRIAEPHHDGCPHWHLLLWMPGDQVQQARELFRRYFLDDHEPTERGAAENRVKFVAIDPRRGTAAGYVAKYVAKNIDGYKLGKDLFGNDEITTAERVDTWAATWRARQFQQIGGAPVGVWRELRRLDGSVPMGPTAEAARIAADAGDWSAYVAVMGGPTVERRQLPLRVAYTAPGERFCPVESMPYAATNRYGEPCAPSVFGIEDAWGARWLSRRFRWEVRRVSGRAQRGPWTRVNNCTDGGRDVGNEGRGSGVRVGRGQGPGINPEHGRSRAGAGRASVGGSGRGAGVHKPGARGGHDRNRADAGGGAWQVRR